MSLKIFQNKDRRRYSAVKGLDTAERKQQFAPDSNLLEAVRVLPYPLIQTIRKANNTEDKALYHKCGQAQTIIYVNHLIRDEEDGLVT